MIAGLRRYLRAFALTLRYTLRGEQPPLLRVRDSYPQLAAWWDQALALVEAVERAADAQQIDPQHTLVHADKRDVSMATILSAVKYHVQREYPHLMAQPNSYSQVTLQATNLNDHYLVMKLAETVDPPLKTAVAALGDHLAELPSA